MDDIFAAFRSEEAAAKAGQTPSEVSAVVAWPHRQATKHFPEDPKFLNLACCSTDPALIEEQLDKLFSNLAKLGHPWLAFAVLSTVSSFCRLLEASAMMT